MSAFQSTGRLWQRLGAPQRAAAAHQHERRPVDSGRLGVGTLTCGRCDAPVAIGPEPRSITEELMCPYCHKRGPARDFLSLATPTRPARVEIRLRFTRTG